MRILHMSDLHLGIKLYEYSLMEDQLHFLGMIIDFVKRQNISCIAIAGDVYDKSTPNLDAVRAFDDFLVSMNELDIPVLIISGNHDSAVRLSFAGRLLEESSVYISPEYDGSVMTVRIEHDGLPVNFYLLPFIRPSDARYFLEDENIKSYDDAMRAVTDSLDINTNDVNVLISHQFVAGGLPCDSDDINVGGLGNIKADAFDKFDYVALGHLHNPQRVQRETIRYCGSPLKYSVSEENAKKSVTVVDIKGKNNINIEEHYIKPLRDVRKLEGGYDELMSYEYYKYTNTHDYLYIILTDEAPIYDAVRRLRSVYPNILRLSYKNAFYNQAVYDEEAYSKELSPLDIVKEFFYNQNGYEMTDRQAEIIEEEINLIWSGAYEAD